MARQAFETPEGDHAALATVLADEVLVTEHEASALVHMRRRRLLALGADQGQMSCTPTLSEMSEPVHVFLLRDTPVPAVWTHQIIITQHAKVEMSDACPFLLMSFDDPSCTRNFRQGRPRRLRCRIRSLGISSPIPRLSPWFSCHEQSSWRRTQPDQRPRLSESDFACFELRALLGFSLIFLDLTANFACRRNILTPNMLASMDR